ncbi:MAG TPA: (5-formylfuran-3-yl)methyl phosphate synthase [Gemmatimonadales bacterium]|nr:(5-formylfuran-3-yl)methyl phosphate synthase [Gemmatimonadales bacterium]
MSVKHSGEADAAVRGGADIIDAKDPSRGPLAALDPDQVGVIARRVPPQIPFSVALGDPASGAEAARLITELPVRRRAAATYAKVGFAGVTTGNGALALLRAAVDAGSRHPAAISVIAVAYADAETDLLNLFAIADLAAAAGAAGVLADTIRKEAGGLAQAVPQDRLRGWIGAARHRGLSVALAGKLDVPDFPWVRMLDPTIIGVRGAACVGGRGGAISSAKVRRLSAAVRDEAEPDRSLADHQSLEPGNQLLHVANYISTGS